MGRGVGGRVGQRQTPLADPRRRKRHCARGPRADAPSDLTTLATHVVSLAKAGVQPVICGSMGESHHLTREERKAVIGAARQALDAAGYTDAVLIAGT